MSINACRVPRSARDFARPSEAGSQNHTEVNHSFGGIIIAMQMRGSVADELKTSGARGLRGVLLDREAGRE